MIRITHHDFVARVYLGGLFSQAPGIVVQVALVTISTVPKTPTKNLVFARCHGN